MRIEKIILTQFIEMLNNSETKHPLLRINLSIIFVMIFSLLVASPILDSFAEEENLVCSEGKVLVYRTISDKYACVYPSTAEKWHTAGFSEPVQQVKSFDIPSTHAEKMRTAAPLPETSMGPQIDYSKGYLIEEIKDGLYWVT